MPVLLGKNVCPMTMRFSCVRGLMILLICVIAVINAVVEFADLLRFALGFNFATGAQAFSKKQAHQWLQAWVSPSADQD